MNLTAPLKQKQKKLTHQIVAHIIITVTLVFQEVCALLRASDMNSQNAEPQMHVG